MAKPHYHVCKWLQLPSGNLTGNIAAPSYDTLEEATARLGATIGTIVAAYGVSPEHVHAVCDLRAGWYTRVVLASGAYVNVQLNPCKLASNVKNAYRCALEAHAECTARELASGIAYVLTPESIVKR